MDLKHLKGLTGLKSLSLQGCDLDGSGFGQLTGLKRLEELRLGSYQNRPLKDESLGALGKLTALRWLALWGTGIRDAGLTRLRPLEELRFLSLESTLITDKGLATVKGFTKLTGLQLGQTKITDTGLDNLSGLTALEALKLERTGITDAGLTKLTRLTRLNNLWIEENPITDEGMKTVAGLQGLKELYAAEIPITDAGVARLAELTRLEHAILSRTGDAGVAALSGLPALRWLQILEAQVTTASLGSFKRMRGLKELYLSGDGINGAFIGRVQAALPGCKVRDPMSENESREAKPKPQNPDWAKKFYEVYNLQDGEVLKLIAPPFIPERLDYYRVAQSFQAESIPEGPDKMVFPWDKKLQNGGMSFGDKGSLASALWYMLGLPRYEYEGDPALLKMEMPGDWIVRMGVPNEQLVAALEKIANEKVPRKIRIVKRPVERDVVVVRGKYAPHPIENYGRLGEIQIYVDKLGPDPNMGGGGSGPLKKFIEWLGSQERWWMLDETGSSTVPVSWHDNDDSSPSGGEPLAADKLERLLKNLAGQTGLEFKKEKRQVEVWMVEEVELGRK